MKCPRCDHKLQIVRTVSAGQAGRTHEALCDVCGSKFTCVTLIVGEARGYGSGAEAFARLIQEGEWHLERR